MYLIKSIDFQDLRDYQVKFMESSLHLDDTNALYAVTFGLKPPKKDETEELHNKVSVLKIKIYFFTN